MKKFFSILLAICLFVGLLTGCSGGGKRVIPDAPLCYVQLDFHGKPFKEYAAQGQVWLLFESSVSPQQAEQILAQNNAKILGKQPEIGYYIVEVEAGTESAFVAKMKDCEEVDYVYPNAIYKAQSATPCVIDNFYGDHGDMVSQMMREASNQVVKEYDAHGNYKKPEDKARYVNGGKIYESLLSCIYFVRSTGSVVINLSSGPPLNSKLERPLWHEQRVSDDDRDFYVIRSINEIVGYVKYTRRYYISSLGNNFVIVKSAGNAGMPNYEAILNGVYKELSSKEIEFFKDHFMIVSAKDDYREGDYPNEISNLGYNEMFTKVDISDKTAVNLHWQGTSYSSPRLAGYIVKAANEFNLNATEVLPHVRRATQKAYNHVIDYEMIEEEIKEYYGIDRQCRINENTNNGRNTSDFPASLIGTKWHKKHRSKFGDPNAYEEWEFLKNGTLKISYYKGSSLKNTEYSWRYFYNSKLNKWKIWNMCCENSRSFYLQDDEGDTRYLEDENYQHNVPREDFYDYFHSFDILNSNVYYSHTYLLTCDNDKLIVDNVDGMRNCTLTRSY